MPPNGQVRYLRIKKTRCDLKNRLLKYLWDKREVFSEVIVEYYTKQKQLGLHVVYFLAQIYLILDKNS